MIWSMIWTWFSLNQNHILKTILRFDLDHIYRDFPIPQYSDWMLIL